MFCKDCIFWIDDNPHDEIIHPIDEDTFEEKEMPFPVKKCLSSSITRFERNPSIRGVSLRDSSMYYVQMYTGPEFGCVNFKSSNQLCI